jgi:hypothetical protein
VVLVIGLCDDKVLNKEIQVHSEASENFGIQLKLMSAMKAASETNDPVGEEQLFSAGNGVAREVTRLVNAIYAAGLHRSVKGKTVH